MSEETTAPKAPARAVAAAESFVAKHGNPTRAVVENIGRNAARVVLVGADGAMGDVVVADVPTAEAVCAQLADLHVGEWDRETIAAAKIGPEHRRRMAGAIGRRV
jgi:hypothetical protein